MICLFMERGLLFSSNSDFLFGSESSIKLNDRETLTIGCLINSLRSFHAYSVAAFWDIEAILSFPLDSVVLSFSFDRLPSLASSIVRRQKIKN